MFAHIYFYRLKYILRDYQNLFWTAAFPLILATLFGLAFSNLNSAETFSLTPVAVVDNAAYKTNAVFQAALTSDTVDEGLFKITLCNKAEAERLLQDNTVLGILELSSEDSLTVTVRQSGIRQSIIKSFADTYLQTTSSYLTVAKTNPLALQNIRPSGDYNAIADVPLKNNLDNVMVYYFALIAMACMYGSFQGLAAVYDAQANQSEVAARASIAPVHKLKLFGAYLSAALTVQIASVLLLIGYLHFVIGIDFGVKVGWTLLAVVISSGMGVTFGAFISALLKQQQGLKIAVIIAISMVCSFLAGLMYRDMKYLVQKHVPILGWLNPANLIADAFYALYYYDTLNRYLLNIGMLTAFSALFFGVVYLIMRRQKYASL